jgi:flagellar hook-length control protein FliK
LPAAPAASAAAAQSSEDAEQPAPPSASSVETGVATPLSAEAAVTPPDQEVAGGEATLAPGGVELENMIDSIRATVQLAARGGMAHARISRQPEELGEIRIHLTQTREGLLARVSAGSQEAARTLMAGRSELADSLRSLGTSLLGLDIETFSQPHTRGEGSGPASPQAGASGVQGDSEPDQMGAAGGPADGPASPLGALVDVLA